MREFMEEENWQLDFEKDGVRYHAVKGYAFAESMEGKVLWSAMDVFTKCAATEEALLELGELLSRGFGRRGNRLP